MIKSSRQRRETIEAHQAGERQEYGTPGQPASQADVYAQQEHQTRIKNASAAYNSTYDIASKYIKDTGDMPGGNTIMKQAFAEYPDMGLLFAEPPEILEFKGNHVYKKGILTQDREHPKTGEMHPAGTPGILVYDEYSDKLIDILPVGEQYKTGTGDGPGGGGGAGGGEDMRKLVGDAFDYAFKGLGFNKEDTFLKLAEMDDNGKVEGLTTEQEKYINDQVEDYIRRFGGDDQWNAYKRGRKRMKRASGTEAQRVIGESTRGGESAPDSAPETTQSSNTSEQWKEYLTTP